MRRLKSWKTVPRRFGMKKDRTANTKIVELLKKTSPRPSDWPVSESRKGRRVTEGLEGTMKSNRNWMVTSVIFTTLLLVAAQPVYPQNTAESVLQRPSLDCPYMSIGSVVEPYRHWDHQERRWNNYQQPRLYGTKWKVVEKYKNMEGSYTYTLQLIEGIYRSSAYVDGKTVKDYKDIGYVTKFFSSIGYLETHLPNSLSQQCAEFRAVK